MNTHYPKNMKMYYPIEDMAYITHLMIIDANKKAALPVEYFIDLVKEIRYIENMYCEYKISYDEAFKRLIEIKKQSEVNPLMSL